MRCSMAESARNAVLRIEKVSAIAVVVENSGPPDPLLLN